MSNRSLSAEPIPGAPAFYTDASCTRRELLEFAGRFGAGLAAAAVANTFLGGCSSDEPAAEVAPSTEEASEVPPTQTPEAIEPLRPEGLRDHALRDRARRITATFEHGTPNLQYGAYERLDDGRGITVGIIGFTSGTGDLLTVVQRYVETSDTDYAVALGGYLDALAAVNGTDSIDGLDGFQEAWRAASYNDSALNEAQDYIDDTTYFARAMELAEEYGITTPAVQAAIYDTMVQHGDGTDPSDDEYYDSLTYLMSVAGPVDGDELAWLDRFLDERWSDLMHPRMKNNPDTAKEWPQSVGRVASLRRLAHTNPNLELPLEWWGYDSSDHYIGDAGGYRRVGS